VLLYFQHIEQTEVYDAQRALPSFAKGYRKFLINCEYFEQYRVLTPTELEYETQTAEEDYDWQTRYRARMREMRNKRPFLSRDGYLGMGPLMTRPGDIAVILLGHEYHMFCGRKGRGSSSF
jgi:hypothetical protein